MVKRLHDSGNSGRQQNVVRVEKYDDVALGRSEAGIQCRCLPAIALVDRLKLRAVALDNEAGIVRRTIINHDDFHARVFLTKRTFDRRRQVGSVIVIVDYDTNERIVVAAWGLSAVRKSCGHCF